MDEIRWASITLDKNKNQVDERPQFKAQNPKTARWEDRQ